MNLGSKSKKRMVLPTRPDPPSVEQMMEDINRACPADPVFSVLQVGEGEGEDLKGGSSSCEAEIRYQQCRRFLELNERLQEARSDLARRREELRAVGESLEKTVAEVKDRAIKQTIL